MPHTPLIVGISGRKRHGKDHVASVVTSCHGAVRIAFADELKRVAMELWDLSFEQVHGDEATKEAIDERWGTSGRVLMQRLGTEVGRNIHQETWVRKAFRTIDAAYRGESVVLPDFSIRAYAPRQWPAGEAALWVVPDCRFPSEAAAIKGVGGVVVKVVRPGMPTTDEHPSETEVDNVREDYLIKNDGSLDDLREQVLSVASRILG